MARLLSRLSTRDLALLELVYPDDVPPFVVSVCFTTPLAVNRADGDACHIVSEITREALAHRR